MNKKWTYEELRFLEPYRTSAKSAFAIYHELNKAGYERTFKAVTKKLESLGYHKPPKYVTGHELKIGYLDIETTDLKANIGHMLSWAIKERDSKNVDYGLITKKELFDETYDKRISQELIDTLKKYDTIVTYYGTGFDIPFMRTRALYYDLDFPKYRELSHHDLYYVVRSKLQLNRSSLKNATEFFGIKGKTPLNPLTWQSARYGNKKALAEVLEHNIEDVKILEPLHKKLELYTAPLVRPI